VHFLHQSCIAPKHISPGGALPKAFAEPPWIQPFRPWRLACCYLAIKGSQCGAGAGRLYVWCCGVSEGVREGGKQKNWEPLRALYKHSRGHGKITGWLDWKHQSLGFLGLASRRTERWVSPAALSGGSSPRARARRPAAAAGPTVCVPSPSFFLPFCRRRHVKTSEGSSSLLHRFDLWVTLLRVLE
jgi:hypothetical protein